MERFRRPVEEYTTPDPVTALEQTPVDELMRLMSENSIRHIPILRDGVVVGIVSERDLKIVETLGMQEKHRFCASDFMVRDPVSVSPDAPLDEVAFEMSSRKIGSVIVGDDDAFLGIFTATDALNALVEIAREPNP